MAAKFRMRRGGGDGVFGVGRNRGMQSVWIVSGGALGGARGAVSRSALPFTMKGGYFGTGSERRLVIVGKIGKF